MSQAADTRNSGEQQRAVVLLSGGLDSATALAIAQAEGFDCTALSVDYGQRQEAELEAAARIARSMAVADHRVVAVNLRAIGGSALTDDIAVPETPGEGIPVTYVPARNTILLSVALGLAEVTRASAIFVGVNAVDYSGYPDCRPVFIEQFEKLAQVATRVTTEGGYITIKAPLIDWTKPQIIQRGTRLGVDYRLTVSCYQPDARGRACGVCDSCRLRSDGFAKAGIADPTRYQSCAD